MQSFAPVINAQEKLASSKSEPCMVVVDPMTRKLLIPCESILPTRAQQRPTIPSLCQLFLGGRCRQGANCHQVHAPLDVVLPLREQVTSLPLCCPQHGDLDHAAALDTAGGLSNAFLHLPESTYNKGYIPLSLVSYTIPVSKLLNELAADTRAAVERHRIAAASGQTLDDTPPLVCLEAGSIPICRLHATSRCHYAEECSFLHLCKKVTEQDPQLPLGRRSRMMKAIPKSPLLAGEAAHLAGRTAPSGAHYTVATAVRRPISNNAFQTASATCNASAGGCGNAPHIRPPCVRGYALTRSPCGVGAAMGNYTAFAALHALPREQQHLLQQLQQQHLTQHATVVCGDANLTLRKKVVERPPHTSRFNNSIHSNSMSSAMECSVLEFKAAASASGAGAESSQMWSAAAVEMKVHSSPISVHTSLSDSMGMGSRDEGLSTSPLNLSGSRSSGRSWRHNPYGFNALKAIKVDQ